MGCWRHWECAPVAWHHDGSQNNNNRCKKRSEWERVVAIFISQSFSAVLSSEMSISVVWDSPKSGIGLTWDIYVPCLSEFSRQWDWKRVGLTEVGYYSLFIFSMPKGRWKTGYDLQLSFCTLNRVVYIYLISSYFYKYIKYTVFL